MNLGNEAKVLDEVGFRELSFRIEDRRGYLTLKRAIDVAISIIGIILCLPLFVTVAVIIKLEDPKGPIFFKQVRVGKHGKEFYMYKFRSMVTNAEELLEDLLVKNEASGHMFKMKDDPRITKIGKFIRKTSIDELPQLMNVLKGEMSLVGPRPQLPREVQGYNSYHWRRLLVPPGCTGLWQVTARSSVGFEEMVELDLQYIENRGILYDLKLIIRTVFVLFGHKNAY